MRLTGRKLRGGCAMQWADDAIVIGLRPHGETAVIVELFTQERGRHKGYVHGGRSRRLRPVLQAGNAVRAQWQARAEEALGAVVLEPLRLRAAALMQSAVTLQAGNHICALLRLLPEREPQGLLFAMAEAILTHLAERDDAAEAILRLELTVLRELGFGLDLSCCAVTGGLDDLAYVSPRTGRAVSRSAGEPYRDRILPLPAFLRGAEAGPQPSPEEVVAAFALTEHFLLRDVFGPRGLPLPACRSAYLAAVMRAAGGG